MNINGGDKRNVFWKRGPDSIHDNHNSNTTWNMLQYIIAGAPNTRSCWISISWCLELADLAFTGSPIYCLAHYFCFYVRTIQACPSGRRFQFTHWWKVQTKMKFLIKTLFTFDKFLIATRAQPVGLVQREVLDPGRSRSETSSLDCCRREADCYHILKRNVGVTYANVAISHPSATPGQYTAWSKILAWFTARLR